MKGLRTVKIEGRTFASGVVHVRTLTICGVRVPVIRATVEQVPELVEDGRLNDGLFCLERLCIFIRVGQSPTHERDTLIHEGVHAFVYLSGLGHVLKSVVGDDKSEGFEEMVVRLATPHLVALIEGNSWA